MSKLKKVLLMCTTYVLVATLAIGGTIAYLQDEDSDVNVMTLGNVSIVQHEYERVVDENGDYEKITVTTKSGSNVDSYKVREFTQAKPLLPVTGKVTGWDDTSVRWEQLADLPLALGGQRPLAGLNNVQDKFVLVENTGKTDAYVRTLIALEYGSNVKDIIGITQGDFWTWNEIGIIEADDNNYFLFEAIYKGADGRHEGGILPAGEYSYNSLGQVYLTSEATNEDCEALDGNKNGTYDILVLSQAVQTAGFADAQTALDTAFGDITTENHPWAGEGNAPAIPAYVSTMTDLEAALAKGGEVNLTADITIPEGEQIKVPAGSTATLNLNGHTITSTSKAYGIRNEGNVTITNGTIEGAFGAIGNYGNAVCVVENATLISEGYPASSSHAIYTSGNSSLTLTNVTVNHEGAGADGSVLYAAGNSTVVINSGNFTWSDTAYTLAAAGNSTVTINGGTFQNDNFFKWGGTIIDNRTND